MRQVWGIDGELFAIGYAALAIAVAAAALLLIARLRRHVSRRRSPPAAELDPYQVAYLRGGAVAAIAAAVSALRARKTAAGLRHGGVVATGAPLPDEAAALEHAVLAAAQRPRSPDALRHDARVSDELRSLDRGLVDAGLLFDAARRRWVWAVGAAVAAVALTGVVRVAAEATAGQATTMLGWVVLGCGIGLGALLARAIRLLRRTPDGEATLAALRHRYAHLKPSEDRVWRPGQIHQAAMGVALFGPLAKYRADEREGTSLRTSVDGSAAGGHGAGGG